jgi:hypothetical protein
VDFPRSLSDEAGQSSINSGSPDVVHVAEASVQPIFSSAGVPLPSRKSCFFLRKLGEAPKLSPGGFRRHGDLA